MNTIIDSLKTELLQAATIQEVIQEDYTSFEAIDFEAVHEKVEQRIMEAVLAIDVEHVLTVVLGCGGPTRYFEIAFTADGGANRGKYVDTHFYGKEDGRTETPLTSAEIDTIVKRYRLQENPIFKD